MYHQPMYGGGGPVVKDQNGTIMPVASLNPYQNKWSIRARVMEKDARSFSNAKGDGKLFNMIVVDATGEVRVTGFTDAYNEHYDKVVVGRVYTISGGTLSRRTRSYTTSHAFEITLNRGSTLDECDEPQGHEAIPRYSFAFTPIAHLEHAPDETKVDVLGVIAECTELTAFTAKSGREMQKRVATLADTSGRSIECTCFGAPSQELAAGSVIAVKGAGWLVVKSLTIWSDNLVTAHPTSRGRAARLEPAGQHAAAAAALRWAGGGGGRGAARRIASPTSTRTRSGRTRSPTTSSARCTSRTSRRTDALYIACPEAEEARRRERGRDAGALRQGDKTQGSRWIFTATCTDTTGSRYISFFDDQAQLLLGQKTADELAEVQRTDPPRFNGWFAAHMFRTYTMNYRVKNEVYMDEQKLKVSATRIAPLDWSLEGRNLLAEIAQLRAPPPPMQSAY